MFFLRIFVFIHSALSLWFLSLQFHLCDCFFHSLLFYTCTEFCDNITVIVYEVQVIHNFQPLSRISGTYQSTYNNYSINIVYGPNIAQLYSSCMLRSTYPPFHLILYLFIKIVPKSGYNELITDILWRRLTDKLIGS